MDCPLEYVVLHHEGIAEPHFDLMFEDTPGGVLVTWRSPIWPLQDGVILQPLPEHRRQYLRYEGPLSGERGRVRRVMTGRFQWLSRAPGTVHIRLLEPALENWLIVTDREGRTRATLS